MPVSRFVLLMPQLFRPRPGRRAVGTAAVVGAAALGIAACGSSTPRVTTPPSSQPLQSVDLWHASGSGDEDGPAFSVPASASHWEERWTLRCPHPYGGSITVIFQGVSATQSSDSGADKHYHQPGSWHGTHEFYDHGRFAPQISATCPWTELITMTIRPS